MLASVLRVMDRTPDGKLSVQESVANLTPPPAGTLRWVDIQGSDDATLEQLRTGFDFHPLAIEDCRRKEPVLTTINPGHSAACIRISSQHPDIVQNHSAGLGALG